MIESLDEFLHRITIEQQEANRSMGKKGCTTWAKMPITRIQAKCAPAQDARQMIYIDMKRKGYWK